MSSLRPLHLPGAFAVAFAMGLFGVTSAHGQGGGPSESSESRVSLGAEVFGRAPYPMTSRGGRIGYDWNSRSGIELAYFQAEQTVLLAEVKTSEADLTYKRMLNGIIHWSYGFGFRRIDLDYGLFVDESEERLDVEERHEAVTVTSRFGFEIPLFFGIRIGCDPIGVSAPVKWTRREDNFPGEASDFEQDPKEFPFVSNAFKLNYQLVRSYVVLAF
jgi:hypothetical protein